MLPAPSEFAHEEIKKHCAVQIELSKGLGKDVKRTTATRSATRLRQTIIHELYTTRLTPSPRAAR